MSRSAMPHSPPRTPPQAQRGFSLIEIMIGLLIGMVSVVIVLQVFSRSDVAKRITNSSNDAQINAMLALNLLEREIRHAGHGISAFGLLGCSLSDGGTLNLSALGPVTINPSTALVPAGDAHTDTLLIVSGNSSSPSEGDPTTAATTADTYRITTASSFAAGDHVVATQSTRPSTCALTLAKVSGVSGTTLSVSNGSTGLAVGDIVYNLGASPSIKAYAVRSGNLTMCDYRTHDCGSSSDTGDDDIWVPVVSHVVSLRAQYARDASSGITGSTSAMTGVVDTYDQTTPGDSSDTASIPVYCRWARIIGVRMAVVGRGTHYDKEQPTGASPTWSGSTANTSTTSTLGTVNPTALPIDLSGLSNYESYRYKLLESAVPLRNIIWQGSQSGC
jgi:type IV pilus assembly protein PilW